MEGGWVKKNQKNCDVKCGRFPKQNMALFIITPWIFTEI